MQIKLFTFVLLFLQLALLNYIQFTDCNPQSGISVVSSTSSFGGYPSYPGGYRYQNVDRPYYGNYPSYGNIGYPGYGGYRPGRYQNGGGYYNDYERPHYRHEHRHHHNYYKR